MAARADRRLVATALWEITRHVLVWYFGTLSQVTVVYGSLTTAIVVLLSLEIAAALLLLGAQVIAEYEEIGTKHQDAPAVPLQTGAPRLMPETLVAEHCEPQAGCGMRAGTR